MDVGFGYWRNLPGFEGSYARLRWVDDHLGNDIENPVARRAWRRLELRNLGHDIDSAKRRGEWNEASDLAYYASRLRAVSE